MIKIRQADENDLRAIRDPVKGTGRINKIT